jgi:hypothetical protein
VPEEKLDLFQLASGCVTESSTRPAQVMRGEPFDPATFALSLTIHQTSFSLILGPHTVPVRLTRRKIAPSLKQQSAIDRELLSPRVAAFSIQLYDRPVLVTLLKMSKRQAGQFARRSRSQGGVPG